MNLQQAVLFEQSKAQVQRIVTWIGNDAQRLSQLIQLFLNGEYRVVQRAAWVLSVIGETHSLILQPYLSQMVNRMTDSKAPVAVKRNVLRTLKHIQLPESLHGQTMDACFQFLANPKETVAVRVFAMTVLQNLSEIYPDIKGELKEIIEEELRHQPKPAFISRAKKVLKQLNKKEKSKAFYN